MNQLESKRLENWKTGQKALFYFICQLVYTNTGTRLQEPIGPVLIEILPTCTITVICNYVASVLEVGKNVEQNSLGKVNH